VRRGRLAACSTAEKRKWDVLGVFNGALPMRLRGATVHENPGGWWTSSMEFALRE
jgi:hypothetical protein